MSKTLDNKRKPLNLSSHEIREVIGELMKKEATVRADAERTLAKVKQYEIRAQRLTNNNYTLRLQMNYHLNNNEAVIAAIVEKTDSIEELNHEIKKWERENEIDLKNSWEAAQSELEFYGRAMVDAQDEYRMINLKNDIDFYKKRAAGVVKDINQLNNDMEVINKQSGLHPCASQLTEVQGVTEMLNAEEDALLREIRAQENIHLELMREIKQLKMEIAELQKP